MNFKDTFNHLCLNEKNQVQAPSPVSTNPNKTDFDTHKSGINVPLKKDFYTHVLQQFLRELDQHYATLMIELEPIEMKFDKAQENRAVSQDSITQVQVIRERIEMIKKVFNLTMKA